MQITFFCIRLEEPKKEIQSNNKNHNEMEIFIFGGMNFCASNQYLIFHIFISYTHET